jgi:uncharacterized protein YjdB
MRKNIWIKLICAVLAFVLVFDVSGAGMGIAGAVEPGTAEEEADIRDAGDLPDESAGGLPDAPQEQPQDEAAPAQEEQAAFAAAPMSGEAIFASAVVDEANTAPGTAIGLTADEARQFTLPAGTDQRWYTINVTEDDAAIQMDLTGFTSSAGSIYAALYDSAAVNQGVTTSNYKWRSPTFNTGRTFYYKAADEGVYYMKLYPSGTSYTVPDPVTLTVGLAEGDGHENNDAWRKAVELVHHVNEQFALNAANDVDWFKITTTAPGEAFKIILSDFDYTVTGYMSMYIYAGAALSANDNAAALKSVTQFKTETNLVWKANTPGDYYIRILPYSTSDYTFAPTKQLKVRYEPIAPDANELNDTWRDAKELTADLNASFTLNAPNDVDWFKVTTAVPGDSFNVIISNFDYTVDPVDMHIYSGTALNANENTGYLTYVTNFKTTTTKAWKADVPGDYYIRIRPNDTSAQYVEKPLRIRYELIPPDDNELNDTYEKATLLQDSVDMPYTLNGINDVDWFKFETVKPGELVRLRFSGFEGDYTNRIAYDVYSAANVSSSHGNIKYDDLVDRGETVSLTFSDVGVYYVKISVSTYLASSYTPMPVMNVLKLRLDRDSAAVDGSEPNNTFETATFIEESVTTQFNLPAATDIDWFTFNVDDPDQTLKLTFTVPPGNQPELHLYSGDELRAKGSSAASYLTYLRNYGGSYMAVGTCVFYFDLTQIGDYYVRLRQYDSSKLTEDIMSIQYDLIVPDEHENNDTWQKAANVNIGADTEFTLPAYNDVDFFKFTVTKPNQTVRLFLQVPAGARDEWYLYKGADFVETGNDAKYIDYYYNHHDSYEYYDGFSVGSYQFYYMLDEPGDYYLKFQPPDYQFSSRGSHSFRVDLAEPDKYDEDNNNNVWQRAAAVNEYISTQFTLPAYNDTDWFKFTVSEPNQTVKITAKAPTGGIANWKLYSGAVLSAQGSASILDSDAVIAAGHSDYYMLKDPGDYYIAFTNNSYINTLYSSSSGTSYDGVLDAYSFSYELIPPDAQEYNNDRVSAPYWGENTPIQITFAASNDVEWFELDDVTEGDVITLSVKGQTGSQQNIFFNLYHQDGYADGFDYGSSLSQSYGATVSYSASAPVRSNTLTAKFSDKSYFIGLGASELDRRNTYPYHDPEGYYYGNSSSYFSEHYFYTNNQPVVFTVSYTIARPGTPLQNLQLMESEINIPEGTVFTMLPKFTPAYASNKGLTWDSDDETVALVDGNGIVTAVAEGSAYITATAADGGHTASCLVNVFEPVPVTGVRLRFASTAYGDSDLPGWFAETGNPGPKDMALASNLRMFADILPENATNFNILWASSDEAVLNVTSDGRVVAVGSGKAKITATTEEGGYTAECWFRVPDESHPVRGVSLDKANATLYLGEGAELMLTAAVSPSYATNQEVAWSSSDERIAVVNDTGVVTPVGIGIVSITVTTEESGKTVSCTVSVQPPRTRAIGIQLEHEQLQLALYAQAAALNVIFAPSDTTDQRVIWSSSNKTVAAVDRYGKITALGLGIATITATSEDGEHTASVAVTVTAGASLGDVCIDGIIDAADALLILRYDVGLLSLSPEQLAVADVNGDGRIDAADAILVLRYAAGLINEF